MFIFLALIKNSVITVFHFFLLSISAIISPNMIDFYFFIWTVFFNIFINITMSFEYSKKAPESLKCFMLAPSCLVIACSVRMFL